MKRILSLILMLSIALALPLIGCTTITSEEKYLPQGKVYDLREEYDAGRIKKDDLLNIAINSGDEHLNTDAIDEGFKSVKVGSLSTLERSAISRDVALQRDLDMIFCGVYNGYYAIKYSSGQDYQFVSNYIKEITIGGVRFSLDYKFDRFALWRPDSDDNIPIVQEKAEITVIADSYEDKIMVPKGEVVTANDFEFFDNKAIIGIYVDKDLTQEYEKTEIMGGEVLYLQLKKTVALTLTKEQIGQIYDEAFKNKDGEVLKFGTYIHFSYYIGNYKGYEIVEFKTDESVSSGTYSSYIFAGFNMKWQQLKYPIYAWKRGEVISLPTLYEKGELDLQDWTAIVEGHYQMHPEMKK